MLFSLLVLVVTTSLSVREVRGSLPGPVKSDTVSPRTIGGGSGEAGGGPGLPLFFQGGLGALIYAFISTILPLHECI